MNDILSRNDAEEMGRTLLTSSNSTLRFVYALVEVLRGEINTLRAAFVPPLSVLTMNEMLTRLQATIENDTRG